jgi:hypothetical protein
MKRFWKAATIALLAVLLLVPGGLLRADDHGGGFRRGDDDDGGRFYFYDPDFYPGYGWGWYNPWWNGGWGWGLGLGWGAPYYYPNSHSGEVKILTTRKNASVYVDGGYVGRASKVKKLRLRPGNHVIQLRNSQGHLFYQERVHVMRGKTIRLDANTPNYPPQADTANRQTGPPAQPERSGRPSTNGQANQP